MDPIPFGLYPSRLGTPEQDQEYVREATGFYAGGGDDVLISGSMPVDTADAPGGYLVNPVVMSGGIGRDTYLFESDLYEWAFISDAGGGRDTITFEASHPFNPAFYDDDIRIDAVLINKRDVLITSTSLVDGGRSNGLIFADPFGKLSKDNKLEKVQFGDESTSFRRFFKSIKKAAKAKDSYSDLYSYSKASYSQLGEAGVLNLSGFEETSGLDDGSYIDIATFNNSLVGAELI